ncbi:MAG: hypothetical protein GX209_03655 [Epulopiscium sp.]|nr:hypothetical protein [Candidatus Epulonipiscium sp.]
MERIYPAFPVSEGFNGLIGVPLSNSAMNDVKMSSDVYEVFVNHDKVGEKVLLTQAEKPEDIHELLKDYGFYDFKLNVVGNSIEIETNEQPQKMKEILSSYLAIR